jgi:diketogulonate reductase-like aldo/keto reductase
MKSITLIAATAVMAVLAADPTVTLNNGVKMPVIALGTWQWDNETAHDAIKLALPLGFTHIDTAENYNNQWGVGKALAGVPRNSFFLTSKTIPCTGTTEEECYNQTMSDFAGDLKALQLDHVDLMLLHGPAHRGKGKCDAAACSKDRGQWKAYQDLYKQGKARAIGVSNYCVTCFDCLLGQPGITVVPAVNQVAFHVGMGDDPEQLVSYCESKNITVQAYSPLGNGLLITDPGLKAIGAVHGKTGPQVALRWIVQKGLPLATKANVTEYLKQDIDVFDWSLTDAEMKALSARTSPASPFGPSWACTA